MAGLNADLVDKLKRSRAEDLLLLPREILNTLTLADFKEITGGNFKTAKTEKIEINLITLILNNRKIAEEVLFEILDRDTLMLAIDEFLKRNNY